ncbi:MAG: hypothetical protein PVH30_04685 [Desulfobacterales bacterium]|jgi:hypothetical protein
MATAERMPLVISIFVLCVGLFSAAAGLANLPFIDPSPPGVYALIAISILLTASGALFMVKALRGDLEPDGVTLSEMRMEAVETITDKALLARIAEKDKHPDVRDKAKQRLEVLHS